MTHNVVGTDRLPRTALRAYLLVLVVMLATACASRAVEPVKPVAPPPTPEEVVVAGTSLLDSYRAAYQARDAAALAPLYLRGLDVMVVHQGRARRGWDAVERFLADFFSGAKLVELELGHAKVFALGADGAVVITDLERRYGDGVTTFAEQGSLMLVLTRVDGQWLIVAEHYSIASGTP